MAGSPMSTIEKIDQWMTIAQRLGYQVRYDYFGGTGGGICQYNGKKILFVDLALTSIEQLEQIRKELACDPLLFSIELPPPMETELRMNNRAA
jgi:hypothetical protein